jgi:CRISPR-associated protein Cmr4
MKKIFFKIQCKTNMHVGSGQANYGVVDNLVQRDPTFRYPTIHASSLKGAIKEFCHHEKLPKMADIFGSEKDETGKSKHESTKVGSYKFFDANLLAIPVRCNKRAFVHITCPNVLNNLNESLTVPHQSLQYLTQLADIGEKQAVAFSDNLNDAVIEDFDIKATYDKSKAELLKKTVINELFNGIDSVVVVSNTLFDRLTNDLHLPVIARNYLENGESKNLWYEQVVPRLSIFWSMCLLPENDTLFAAQEGSFKGLFADDALIQIGANGSIGYGYCKFNKINMG